MTTSNNNIPTAMNSTLKSFLRILIPAALLTLLLAAAAKAQDRTITLDEAIKLDHLIFESPVLFTFFLNCQFALLNLSSVFFTMLIFNPVKKPSTRFSIKILSRISTHSKCV